MHGSLNLSTEQVKLLYLFVIIVTRSVMHSSSIFTFWFSQLWCKVSRVDLCLNLTDEEAAQNSEMTDPPSYRQGWCLTHVSSGNTCWIGRHPDILTSCSSLAGSLHRTQANPQPCRIFRFRAYYISLGLFILFL